MITTLPPAWAAPDADRMRAARAAREAGTPVVGVVGGVVPLEMIVAAGCFPLGLMARVEDSGRVCAAMEAGHEPEIQSLFLQAVEGEFELCDLLVVPSTSDAYRYLFQYLKEMQRRGEGERIPPLHHFDFLFGPSPAIRRYSLNRLVDFQRRLEVLTGRPAAADALRGAIAQGNAARAQIARLNDLRAAGQVGGSLAHQAIRAACFADPASHAALMGDWLAQIEAAPAATVATVAAAAPRLLLVSAVPLHHEFLHRACESAAAIVVAEDDEWGARRGAPAVEVDAEPLAALERHIATHAVSPRLWRAEREAWVTAQFGSGRYDGVVFYLPPSDQHVGWRYPALRSLAESRGLATLLLRDDVVEQGADAAAALQAFVASLPTRSRFAS